MATVDPKAPARAPAQPKPAAVSQAAQPKPPAVEQEPEQNSEPIIERISIGSLVVKKTTWDDGDTEMSEVKTIKAGPDERFKSWRYAQPA